MSFSMTLRKFWISSMKSIAWERNHITMGHLWKLLRAVHSLDHPVPHAFAIWNLDAERALAAFQVSFLLNLFLFWSTCNLPLCCLPLSRGSMGVYCAAGCISNCLIMGLLNMVGLFLLHEMSFALSILYINASRILRTEWRSLMTVG